MAHKDMEQRIRQAFEAATPDVLDGVLRNCEQQKGTVISMTSKKRNNWVPRVISIAAVLALIICAGFGFGYYRSNYAVDSVISLDVNPSLELKVNARSKVIEAVALNEDGIKILGQMNLKGEELETAVNAILGSMVRNGYLTEAANSILVSVNSKDSDRAVALQDTITKEVHSTLESQPFEGAVISQTVTEDSALKQKAESSSISLGKAKLIDRILTQDTRYTFEELAKLSVNELNLLTESGKLHLEDVRSSGSASEKKYIGKEQAIKAALDHAQLNQSDVTRLTVELDAEDGIMIYEVEFHTAEYEYEYGINAASGEVVYSEKETHSPRDEDDKPVLPPEFTLISEEKAIAAALSHAGLESAEAIQCELEKERNVHYYEVEFSAGGVEYEYLVDALTGKVVRHEKEHPESDHPVSTDPSVETMSVETIKATVMAHAGVTEVTDFSCELERDHNRLVYKVEFKGSSVEYEYIVDALTGEILHFRKETGDRNVHAANPESPDSSQTVPSRPGTPSLPEEHKPEGNVPVDAPRQDLQPLHNDRYPHPEDEDDD